MFSVAGGRGVEAAWKVVILQVWVRVPSVALRLGHLQVNIVFSAGPGGIGVTVPLFDAACSVYGF